MRLAAPGIERMAVIDVGTWQASHFSGQGLATNLTGKLKIINQVRNSHARQCRYDQGPIQKLWVRI